MQHERVTEEFVRLFREINRVTNSDPKRVKELAKAKNSVSGVIKKLHDLFSEIEQDRKHFPNKWVVQAHPGFLKAFGEYKADWQNSWIDALDLDLDLEFELSAEASLVDNKQSKSSTSFLSDDFVWGMEAEFDPDEKTAASDLASVREYIEGKVDDSPFYERAVKSWKWFDETVGIDLTEIERRWHQFPMLVIKKAVSDKHGLSEKRSLFAYLKDVRTAYVAGAYLAAIAMCRAITEILINDHLKEGTETKYKTIKRLDDTYPELAKYNISAKMEVANFLLHFNPEFNITNDRQAELIILNWIEPIQILINLAPESSVE